MSNRARCLKAAITLATLLLAACADPEPLHLSGSTMGTTYRISVAGCPLRNCATELDARVTTRLEELNQALSHYREASALSNFNRTAQTDWQPVPEDLAVVAGAARNIAARTGGAFDPTVAPAVDLWGFGPTEPPQTVPTPAAIEAVRMQVGYAAFEVRPTPPALRKARAGLQLDLSALAKGYAVDQLSLLLEAANVRDYLVDIGGELRVAGARYGAPWRIAIEPPQDDLGIDYIIAPGPAAVATSGDYRNFYRLNERRVSHTIDPRTGEPVSHTLAAVSVVAVSAMEADALATALLVMGPEPAARFAREESLAALLFVRTPAGVSARMTPEFAAHLIGD